MDSPRSRDAERSVAAIVVTHNRADVLEDTLRGIAAQQRRPEAVVVIDNASSDDTRARVARGWPDCTLIALPDNAGHGAGLAAGLSGAIADHHDVFWMLDDDSTPAPEALSRLLQALTCARQPGVVGTSGGTVRRGRIRHARSAEDIAGLPSSGTGVSVCDFTLFDGAIVTKEAIDAVGLPRDDFFIMVDDIEFTTRVKRAGFDVMIIDTDLIDRGHLGSSGATDASQWRGYYQARNHLRLALDRRSPTLLWGWFQREAAHGARYVWSAPGRRRLRLRAGGARDAALHRMGRTVEPGSA